MNHKTNFLLLCSLVASILVESCSVRESRGPSSLETTIDEIESAPTELPPTSPIISTPSLTAISPPIIKEIHKYVYDSVVLSNDSSLIIATDAGLEALETSGLDSIWKKSSSNGDYYVSVVASPDGRYLAANHGGAVEILNAETGALIAEPPISVLDDAFAWSPDGAYLASAGGGEFYLWNRIEDQTATLSKSYFTDGDSDAAVGVVIHDVEWSPDLSLLAVMTTAGFWVIDPFTTEEIYHSGSPVLPGGLDWCSEGDLVSFAYIGTSGILVIDSQGQQLFSFHNADHNYYSVKFSPDGRSLAGGTRNGLVDIWDLESGEILYQFESGGPEVTNIAFSTDSHKIAASLADGSLLIWNLITDQISYYLQSGLPAGHVADFLVSPFDHQLVVELKPTSLKGWARNDYYHSITFWDLEHGRLTQELVSQ